MPGAAGTQRMGTELPLSPWQVHQLRRAGLNFAVLLPAASRHALPRARALASPDARHRCRWKPEAPGREGATSHLSTVEG